MISVKVHYHVIFVTLHYNVISITLCYVFMLFPLQLFLITLRCNIPSSNTFHYVLMQVSLKYIIWCNCCYFCCSIMCVTLCYMNFVILLSNFHYDFHCVMLKQVPRTCTDLAFLAVEGVDRCISFSFLALLCYTNRHVSISTAERVQILLTFAGKHTSLPICK